MTTTRADELRDVLDRADPNTLADALRKVRLGRMIDPLKVTIAGLAASATIDITSAAALAAATVNQGDIASGERLPPILSVVALRVSAVGAAVLGPRVVTDAGGTPVGHATGIGNAPGGVATLSDDGKTLTFENTVTGIVIEYIPRSSTDTTSAF